MTGAAPGTRERILEAATTLFAEQDFRRVTVRAICRAAGVNVAAVNYHFGDKAALYREVVQAVLDAMRGTTEESRRLGEGLPPEEQLRVFVRTFVRRLLEAGQRGQPRIQRLFQREMAQPSEHLERVIAEGVRPRIEYLSGILSRMLGCPVHDARVLRCIFSIQSQALAVVPNPIARRLGFAPTPADADLLADHIARFSLGGVRAVARAAPAAPGAPILSVREPLPSDPPRSRGRSRSRALPR